MLDLVRRTCDNAQEMSDFEGVYEPDPEQVREWQEREAEEYGGEYRFVNLGPMEVKRRLEGEVPPEDLEALRYAESYWRKAGGYSGQMQAGSVYRGEPRQEIRAESMSELADLVSPVAHVFVGGTLAAGGIPTMSEGEGPEDYVDRGIIDWGHLLSQGPLPETEDWF